MNQTVISLTNVSMRFNLSREKVYSLKEYFVKRIKNQIHYEEFWALKNISLNINRGEVFGVVGFNGAGKSTLLKIVAGILKPTTGVVKVQGTIAPLIELGAGFDMDLTGYENIFLNGSVLGYSKKVIHNKLDDIIQFSELHDFMDVPLKNYSSGMIARLGFSIATCIEPDILIVDEILSVGDYKFQEKCHNRIKSMLRKGTTVIFVSHSIDQIKEICDRAALLEKGQISMVGNVEEVCDMFSSR